MILEAEEGTWLPRIALIRVDNNVEHTSGVTVNYHEHSESPPEQGDRYGNYTRIGKRVFLDFCTEFTLSYNGLPVACYIMVKDLPFAPGVGVPVDAPNTTNGTNIGTLFMSTHSRFGAAALPSLPAGMESMNCVVTPFWNAVHFEGFNASYSPMLFTTSHFLSGSRRYIRGEVHYITDDAFSS